MDHLNFCRGLHPIPRAPWWERVVDYFRNMKFRRYRRQFSSIGSIYENELKLMDEEANAQLDKETA